MCRFTSDLLNQSTYIHIWPCLLTSLNMLCPLPPLGCRRQPEMRMKQANGRWKEAAIQVLLVLVWAQSKTRFSVFSPKSIRGHPQGALASHLDSNPGAQVVPWAPLFPAPYAQGPGTKLIVLPIPLPISPSPPLHNPPAFCPSSYTFHLICPAATQMSGHLGKAAAGLQWEPALGLDWSQHGLLHCTGPE